MPVRVDHRQLLDGVGRGPGHEPRLVEVLLGERFHALHRHVARDLEPRGRRREVDERERIAVDVSHPRDLVRGLDLDVHVDDPQVVTFAGPQHEPMLPEGYGLRV